MKVNFDQNSSYMNGIACKNFFTWFYWGMIAGSFIWPFIIKYVSLRNSLLSALVVQMIATYYMSQTTNLQVIFILRLICGLFMNINNVGKAFIFQFAPESLQQWGFTCKNTWGIIASFLCPILGYKIYNMLNQDFFKVCIYVSILYFVSILIYYIIFYIFTTIKPYNEEKKEDEEEKIELINKENKVNIDQPEDLYSLWGITKFIWSQVYLRNFIIVYMITNGVFKTMNLLSVLFLERETAE